MTDRELHYRATVDREEWEVSSIDVMEQWKLKHLREALLSENLWDDQSTVAFFRNNPAARRLPLTTKLQALLRDNRAENPLVVVVSTPEIGGRKRRHVFPMLDPPVDGGKVKVWYKVGEGATSDVYAAQHGDVSGVVKVMKNQYRHIANHEKSILDHLHESGVAGLLKCTKVSEGVLFFDRMLRPFIGTFSIEKVAALLDCLEQVHAAGVVHRDIRPENILEDGDGHLYLIDWGFALSTRDCDLEPPPFAGTFRYGSEAVVRAAHAGKRHQYTAVDDLEAFVKTVVAINSGERRILNKMSAISPGDFGTALRLWSEEREHRSASFNGMFEAAKAQDYEELKKLLVY